MRRYLRLLGIFYKAALLTDLEYRANFIVNIFLSLIGICWSVAGVAIFFLHTDEIRGWHFNELMIVLGLFLVFLGIVEMLLVPNVQDLMEHIRLGTLDFILTKPINSQFHASLRRINIWRMVDVLMGVGVVSYGIAHMPAWPSLPQILLFPILCLCGIIILYSLVMLLATSAFWFVQLENVMELLSTFFEAGRFPITIFPAWVRILLTFIIPVAFITTVPASVLLGRLDGMFALYSLGVTAALFATSVLYWRYALRHYSSASS